MNNATWNVTEGANAAIPCNNVKELGHYCVAEFPACIFFNFLFVENIKEKEYYN